MKTTIIEKNSSFLRDYVIYKQCPKLSKMSIAILDKSYYFLIEMDDENFYIDAGAGTGIYDKKNWTINQAIFDQFEGMWQY